MSDRGDIWPLAFYVNLGSAYELRVAFYDDINSTWSRTSVGMDFFSAQTLPQRTGWCWLPTGTWGYMIVESGSLDLELWTNADTGWRAGGAWSVLDDYTSVDYDSVDVKVRQNYVWAVAKKDSSNFFDIFSIRTETGTPALGVVQSPGARIADTGYSFDLDKTLAGTIHIAGVDTVTAGLTYFGPSAEPTLPIDWQNTIKAAGASPEIICDNYNNVFAFFTDSNILYMSIWDGNSSTAWPQQEVVYIASDTLTHDYAVTHNPNDDTFHVVIVNYDSVAAAYTLVYRRRTRNGWEEPLDIEILSMLSLPPMGFCCPQITIDQHNNLRIFVIKKDFSVPRGDINSYYLPNIEYQYYSNPLTWANTTDIDDSSDDIVALDAPRRCIP